MPKEAYNSQEDEYWYNVSPQDTLPLAGVVDLEIDLKQVAFLFTKISETDNIEAANTILYNEMLDKPILFSYVRQFLGISDKRAYLDLSYIASRIKHPTQNSSLTGCQPWSLSRHPMAFFLRLLSGSQGKQVQQVAAKMIAKYLIDQGLYTTAKGFSNINEEIMKLIYTRLIVPKEYQQKAAKRRGHGCEAALAYVLQNLGLTIIPENKATDPMGSNDPHIDLNTMEIVSRSQGHTHAFDTIIMNKDKPNVLIQSLIHTSDPGQFGVDKSNETVAIYNEVKNWNITNKRKIELWGLFDGVGYSENKVDTINKLIKNVDYFVQIKTLYKAPLRLHKLGFIKLNAIKFKSHYDKDDIESIKKLYIADDIIIANYNNIDKKWKEIECGEAHIYI